jgi:hypothetical protein
MDKYERNKDREAVFENSDVVKFRRTERSTVREWIFSSRLGWNRLPDNKMWLYERFILQPTCAKL